MLTNLDAVIERLIAGYEPERIILFGSHATGRAQEGSDIDLLIVKETDRVPLERRIEVERILSDRLVSLDLLVYTPQELWDLYAAGSSFLEDVLAQGRVLYMRKATAAWIAEATDELDSAAILFDHHKYRGVCLHSQQSVEKGLKALLLEKGRPLTRTHDIVELLNLVTAEGWTVSLPMDETIFLNSVYRGRYPTEQGLLPHGEPGEGDAHRALQAAKTLMQQVGDLLGKSGAP
jgi:HEPN domain-containing protein/predicted nucleotidyltransferase